MRRKLARPFSMQMRDPTSFEMLMLVSPYLHRLITEQTCVRAGVNFITGELLLDSILQSYN